MVAVNIANVGSCIILDMVILVIFVKGSAKKAFRHSPGFIKDYPKKRNLILSLLVCFCFIFTLLFLLCFKDTCLFLFSCCFLLSNVVLYLTDTNVLSAVISQTIEGGQICPHFLAISVAPKNLTTITGCA